MSRLTQENFPRLWMLFQKMVGGTVAKQKLALQRYDNEKRILEIGCSVGNVSEAFTKFPEIQFTGIDIDRKAIDLAKSKFASFPNFHFEDVSLENLAKKGERFDFILFANILHHVNDITAGKLLNNICSVVENGAKIIIMEPEKKRSDYGLAFRLFYLLEKGGFRRSEQELIELVRQSGLRIVSASGVLVAPDSMPCLKVGRITFIEAAPAK